MYLNLYPDTSIYKSFTMYSLCYTHRDNVFRVLYLMLSIVLCVKETNSLSEETVW